MLENYWDSLTKCGSYWKISVHAWIEIGKHYWRNLIDWIRLNYYGFDTTQCKRHEKITIIGQLIQTAALQWIKIITKIVSVPIPIPTTNWKSGQRSIKPQSKSIE